MTLVYTLGTFAANRDLEQKARAQYIIAYDAKYSYAKTIMVKNYRHKFTDQVRDTEIQLDRTGKEYHAEGLSSIIPHPDFPTTDKTLMAYEVSHEGNDMKTAYYYKPAGRTALGADAAISTITKEQAKDLGFFPIAEEDRD